MLHSLLYDIDIVNTQGSMSASMGSGLLESTPMRVSSSRADVSLFALHQQTDPLTPAPWPLLLQLQTCARPPYPPLRRHRPHYYPLLLTLQLP